LLTILFKLIVGYIKLLALKRIVMEVLTSIGGYIWGFEADESVEMLLLTLWHEFHAFNLTVMAKEVSELLFSCVGREILDIEIASLFRILVSNHLLFLLFVSLLF
jgi:hypothetical protein